jgi:Predicted thioesterase involved in non-ribosomal peptide biosynthesis
LRHDFTLYEQHIYRKRPPLDCPITVFGGRGDPNINEHHLMGWKQETKQAFTLKWFDGDHFFLFQHERLLADIIRKAVTPELFTLTS